MHRHIAAVAVLTACLAAPGVASADSGAITNPTDGGGGWILATYTTSSTCAGDPGGACVWYPYAVQVPADRPCAPWDWASPTLTWTGGSDDGLHGTGEATGSDYFKPAWNPVRVCLYNRYTSTAVTPTRRSCSQRRC